MVIPTEYTHTQIQYIEPRLIGMAAFVIDKRVSRFNSNTVIESKNRDICGLIYTLGIAC